MNKFCRKLAENKKGFSILEVTIVVIIFTIVSGLSVLFYQSMQGRSDIASISSGFAEIARVTQGDAAAGKKGLKHGIHLETNKYVIFEGDSYSVNASTNYSVTLPFSITIQNISLNGGGSDIVFSSPRGETTNYGTFSFAYSQINKSKSITITKVGTVNF